MMTSKGQDKQASSKERATIATWIRVVLGVLGGVCLVVGYFAIMRPNTPEVGGVAFVALGGAFAVLAAIGRIPQKLNAAGIAVEFPDSEDVVEAAEAIPPDERLLFAARLGAKTEGSAEGRLASDLIRTGAEFEKAVLEALAAHGLLVSDRVVIPRGHDAFDAIILVRDRFYTVEIKSKWSQAAFRQFVFQLASPRLLEFQIAGGIMILPDNEAERARALLERDVYYPIPVEMRIKIVGLSELASLRDSSWN